MLICDRMGISYTELYSDEMPNMAVEDYLIVMKEEAEEMKRRK